MPARRLRPRVTRGIPDTHRYTVTDHGFRLAVFLTRVHNRLLRPGLADLLDSHDPDSPLRREFNRLDSAIDNLSKKHNLAA